MPSIINEHAMASNLGWQTPVLDLSSFLCQTAESPYKVRAAFPKPVHAARARVGPSVASHGPFAAKLSSCHVHSNLWVTPLTSPCLTLSVVIEPTRKYSETIFSMQYDVTKSAL